MNRKWDKGAGCDGGRRAGGGSSSCRKRAAPVERCHLRTGVELGRTVPETGTAEQAAVMEQLGKQEMLTWHWQLSQERNERWAGKG